MLKTKSIQKRAFQTDGIRICTMRRIKPEFVFDIWIPLLSPSTQLLESYHANTVSWEEFENLLHKELFPKQDAILTMIADLSNKTTVTLLCWEKTPEKCHRRLLAEEILTRFPDMERKIA